jgi:hypothetical protein
MITELLKKSERQFKKFLESQKMCDVAKAVLRRKFIAMSTESESTQINSLMKVLEKQAKPTISRQKDIIILDRN